MNIFISLTFKKKFTAFKKLVLHNLFHRMLVLFVIIGW